MKISKSNVLVLLFTADTKLLRFWFALASLAYATWLVLDPNYSVIHPLSVQVAPAEALAILCCIHGVSMLYGVFTGYYSTVLLFLEAILGVFLWVGLGIAHAYEQGTPGPMLIAGGGISLFLLIRYPTHYSGAACD